MTEDMTIIAEEAYLAAKEILEKARLEQGELFVVGCSTSEVGCYYRYLFQPGAGGDGLRRYLPGHAGSRGISGCAVL